MLYMLPGGIDVLGAYFYLPTGTDVASKAKAILRDLPRRVLRLEISES